MTPFEEIVSLLCVWWLVGFCLTGKMEGCRKEFLFGIRAFCLLLWLNPEMRWEDILCVEVIERDRCVFVYRHMLTCSDSHFYEQLHCQSPDMK